MRSFFAVCFSLFLGVGICSSQATTLHDASLEFSGVDNPNGQWSYHVGQAFGNPQQPYDTLSVQGTAGRCRCHGDKQVSRAARSFPSVSESPIRELPIHAGRFQSQST